MNRMRRAMAVSLPLAGIPAAWWGPSAHAASFPDRPVKIIVPYGAGTLTDTVARMATERLAQTWRQGVVVENVTGAGGAIGTRAIATARPDGHVIGLVASSMSMSAALYPQLPYDTLKDIQPLAQIWAFADFLIVSHPSLGADNLERLIALAKAEPDKVDYASTGIGSLPHMAMEKFMYTTGVKLHHVPYRATGAALNDLLAGRVKVFAGAGSTLMPHIKSGALKALAITSNKRSPLLPDVPTAGESGAPGFEIRNWVGFVVPAGVPGEVSGKLAADILALFRDASFSAELERYGVMLDLLSAKPFGDLIKNDIVEWQKIVKAGNIKPE